jgi:ribosomal protein S18 acetylase RimI-like enzyme
MKPKIIMPEDKKAKRTLVTAIENLIEEDKSRYWFPRRYKDPKYYEEEYIKQGKYDVLAMEQGNAVTGYIIGRKETSHIYNVEMHYVLPNMRGFGIAKQLKQALENIARQQGFKIMASYTSTDNYASIRLNEATNYRQETIGNYIYFKKEL